MPDSIQGRRHEKNLSRLRAHHRRSIRACAGAKNRPRRRLSEPPDPRRRGLYTGRTTRHLRAVDSGEADRRTTSASGGRQPAGRRRHHRQPYRGGRTGRRSHLVVGVVSACHLARGASQNAIRYDQGPGRHYAHRKRHLCAGGNTRAQHQNRTGTDCAGQSKTGADQFLLGRHRQRHPFRW